MPRLRIDLREGFTGDTVEVALDGRVVYARAGVRTDYSVGLADFVETEVATPAATIEVRLKERKLAGRLQAKLAGATTYVAVVAAPDRISIHQLDGPPRYF